MLFKKCPCLRGKKDIFTTLLFDENIENLRKLISLSALNGVAVPAMSSALSYIDTYNSATTGANLIQAQRDYFGAHTFERVDKEGSFHFDWIKNV